jgi:hypothetical protein
MVYLGRWSQEKLLTAENGAELRSAGRAGRPSPHLQKQPPVLADGCMLTGV